MTWITEKMYYNLNKEYRGGDIIFVKKLTTNKAFTLVIKNYDWCLSGNIILFQKKSESVAHGL